MSQFKTELISDGIIFISNDKSEMIEESKKDVIDFFEKNPKVGLVYTDFKFKFKDHFKNEYVTFSNDLPNVPFFARKSDEEYSNAKNFVEIMQKIISMGYFHSHLPILGCVVDAD